MSNPSLASGIGNLWLVLLAFYSVVTFVFWMVIAWRAVRAHERIAATLEQRLPR